MGICSQAILSYGITIPQSKIVSLLHALRNIPRLPGEPAEWYDTHDPKERDSKQGDPEEQDSEQGEPEEWDSEQSEELSSRLKRQLKQAGINEEEFVLETLGPCDEWEGQAVLYQGKYSKEDEGNTAGVTVEVWGSDCNGSFKSLISKPWENQGLIQDANQAFKRLAEIPAFKEIQVAPEWLHGVTVS